MYDPESCFKCNTRYYDSVLYTVYQIELINVGVSLSL